MQESMLASKNRLGRQRQASSASAERNKYRIDNLIVIGTSRGGHRALAKIFRDFSVDMPAVIVIILHQPLNRLPTFKTILERYCRLPIKEVVDQERLQQGFIFVPPPGKSAEFTKGMLRVKHDVPKMRVNTINHMFKSAARSYGERAIGVILTGLLKDGTDGLHAVQKMGGVTMVQNPKEAEYGDMPANAMEDLPVTFCLKLAEIGPALELLVRRSTRFETGLTVAVRTLRDRIALLVRMSVQSQRNPRTYSFLKSELASLKQNLRALEDFVETQTQTQTQTQTHALSLCPPIARLAKVQRFPRNFAKPRDARGSDGYAEPQSYPRIKVMDTAETDDLAARTKEMVESSDELVRHSKVSIKQWKDARRRSRNLIKRSRTG